MDAINPINPSALFMIKGADQTIYTTNGGQGFVTDQQLITAAQCSNPNAFFRSLLAKSYSTQASVFAQYCVRRHLFNCHLTITICDKSDTILTCTLLIVQLILQARLSCTNSS